MAGGSVDDEVRSRARGDELSFDAYALARETDLLRVALLVAGDRQEADAVEAEVLGRVAASWRSVQRDRSDPDRLLWRTAAQVLLPRRGPLKGRVRGSESGRAAAEPYDLAGALSFDDPSADPTVGSLSEAAQLSEGIATLTRDERFALALTTVTERTRDEAAHAMGVRVEVVDVLLAHAIDVVAAALPIGRIPSSQARGLRHVLSSAQVDRGLPEQVWQATRRRSRRRRRAWVATALAIVLALVVGSLVRTALGPDATDAPAGSAPENPQQLGPNGAPGVVYVTAPSLRDQGRLPPDPLRLAPYPFDDERVPSLSARPIKVGVAAAQREPGAPLLVLDDRGRFSRVSLVGLAPVTDVHGDPLTVLRPGSLSSDGSTLALAQPDGVVVVDLASGLRDAYKLGIPVDSVHWVDAIPDDRRWVGGPPYLIAGGPDGTRVIDPDATPQVATVGYVAADSAVTERGRVMEVSPTLLRERQLITSGTRGVDKPAEVVDWEGEPVALHDHVARAGHLAETGAPGIAIMDFPEGTVYRFLVEGGGRSPDCCHPVAWISTFTLLLHESDEGQYAWNLTQNTFTRVGSWPVQTLSVAARALGIDEG